MLATHRRVVAGGELDILPALVQTELAPYPASMAGATADALGNMSRRYLQTLSGLYPGAEYVTDKRPDNFLNIGLIKTLFPDARIVHTTRNALDNCLSIYFLHLDQRMSYALDLLDIGHYYREYRRLMAHWQALYGPDILDFEYEAYLRDPGPAVERLLEFCGLAADDNGRKGSGTDRRRQDGERVAGARGSSPAFCRTLAELRAPVVGAPRRPRRADRRSAMTARGDAP